MSITDQITSLFAQGAQSITIGKPQQANAPDFFIQAAQLVSRGSTGNHIVCNHQVAGDNIPDCLNRLAEQMDDTWQMNKEPSGIVKLNGGRV
jgi:hypothetical protein